VAIGSGLQPLAEAMFASCASVLGALVDRNVTPGTVTSFAAEGSLRVDDRWVAALAEIPDASLSVVLRFDKRDFARVVDAMLGNPASGDDGEVDAMQLSIVSETVLQIAGAMAEKLATDLGRTAEGLRTEVIDQTAGFPAPPYTVFAAPIDMGATHTTVEICFDGQAANRVEQATGVAAPEPRRAPEPQPMPPPPRAQRPAPESRPASFATMTPTPLRAAAPGQANLDLVHDVPLQISAVLGRTSLSLRDVVALQSGSVFELDKLSTDPIDLYVNNILIARGEVVVVDDKFAVKISELNPNAEKS
jgi:flagellar motor switch protein FliN/FliY